MQVKNGRLVLPKTEGARIPEEQTLEEVVAEIRGDKNTATLMLGDDLQKIDYQLSPVLQSDRRAMMCSVSSPRNEGIKIHRVNCPNAVQLMSNFAYRIVKAAGRERTPWSSSPASGSAASTMWAW
jgi:guanosine-3',5'-bis(diphosphate) 3'-pyrophosphohydrolase